MKNRHVRATVYNELAARRRSLAAVQLGCTFHMQTEADIVRKFNSEFQRYVKIVEPGLEKLLSDKAAPYQSMLRYLKDFYFYMCYLVDHGLIPNDSKHVAFRTLTAKASMSVFGMYNLLMNGVVTEAVISLRSLFEVYVNLKLIVEKDTESRSRLYENFEFVERRNNLEANLTLLTNGNLTLAQFERSIGPSTVDKIKSEFNSVKNDYHPKQPFHWAWKIYGGPKNPSLRFISDSLGLSFDYVKVYGSTSISTHASASLVNIVSDGNAITLAPQFPILISSYTCIALDYCAENSTTSSELFQVRKSK